MRFLLRPDFPNVYITDEAGRDVYWVRSGVADQVGLWSLRDLGGRELVQVAQHGPRLAPSYGVYRAGGRVATVLQEPARGAGRWRSGVRTLVAGAPAKLRYTVRSDGSEPLDVEGDPAERRSVIFEHLRLASRLRQELAEWLKTETRDSIQGRQPAQAEKGR